MSKIHPETGIDVDKAGHASRSFLRNSARLLRSDLAGIVAFMTLTGATSPAFADPPPDELTLPPATMGAPPQLVSPLDDKPPLETKTASAPSLEEAVARLYASNSDANGAANHALSTSAGVSTLDASSVVVVVADQTLSASIRDQVEARLEASLNKIGAAKIVLRGRAHLGLAAAPRQSNSALVALATKQGADEVVVLRTPFLVNTGEVMLQRITTTGQTISEVAHAPTLRVTVGSPTTAGVGNAIQRGATNGTRARKIRPSVLAGVSASNADAFRAFRRQAIRLTQRRMHSGWGREASVVGFHSYAPDGKRMSRAELMRYLGDDDAASRAELGASAWAWSSSGAGLIMVTSMFLGMLAGTVFVTATGMISDPEADADTLGFIAMGTLLGALGGTGPAAVTAVFPVFLTEFSDDDAIEMVRQHNLKIADSVGFPRDEVPFTYFGY